MLLTRTLLVSFCNGLSRACSSTNRPYNEDKKKLQIWKNSKKLRLLQESFNVDEQNELVVPYFKRSLFFADQTAVKDACGDYTYLQLYISAKKLASQISNICGSGASLHVAYIQVNNVLSALTEWACWLSGQVIVPLNSKFPLEMLKYLIQDSQAKLLIGSTQVLNESETLATQLEMPLVVVDHAFLAPLVDFDESMKNLLLANNGRVIVEGVLNNDFYTQSNAMLLYTSGATRKPKGALFTHKSLQTQLQSLQKSWQFTASDSLLHALPFKHMHGCFSAFHCPFSVGGKITMHEDFNSHNVWSTILGVNAPVKDRVNMFLAIPTMYIQLIGEYDKIFSKNLRMVKYIENYCRKNIRLMICAAAPLLETVFHRWREITGHNLLQCYSTTETGIALANPYEENGNQRRFITVGLPMAGVNLRLVDSSKQLIMKWPQEESRNDKESTKEGIIGMNPAKKSEAEFIKERKPVGELKLGGAKVFTGYFNRPQVTEEFYDGEYFMTGDIVAFEDGVFDVLGSSDVHIIETEGHKVCSLVLETLLITHPCIKDVAVLGIPDTIVGERIGVICVLKPEANLDLNTLKTFCAQMLPTHKHPSTLQIVEGLPREGSTKTSKLKLIKMFFSRKNKV